MRVEIRGEGEPEYTVIGAIHGDEPCGKKAVERVLEEEPGFRKPVQFILANEEALEQNTRFIDTDLNRSFPGDPESEKHEQRLAAEIIDRVEGTEVIDLHSTRSYPEPFTNFSHLDQKTAEIIRATGVENAVHFPTESGSLNEHVDGVVVECGHQGTEQAAENAYRVTRNFLACRDVLEGRCTETDPVVFRHTGSVSGSGFEFVKQNFAVVEAGEVFARKGDEELVAEERFYPVLMSTDGYEDIVGNKAEKLGRLSELI